MFYIIIGLLDFRHQAAFIHVKQDSVQSESTIREVKINEQFKKQVDFINLPYNDDDDECKHMSFYFVTHKKLLRRIQSIKENLYNMLVVCTVVVAMVIITTAMTYYQAEYTR